MTAGTIEKLSSGRFAARLPRTLDPRRRRIGTYPTHEEAETILNGALAVAQKKTITEPKGETLRSFLPGFLDRRELSGVRNIDRDRNAAKGHIETADFFGTPLAKLKRVQVSDWLDHLQRKKSKRTWRAARASDHAKRAEPPARVFSGSVGSRPDVAKSSP